MTAVSGQPWVQTPMPASPRLREMVWMAADPVYEYYEEGAAGVMLQNLLS